MREERGRGKEGRRGNGGGRGKEGERKYCRGHWKWLGRDKLRYQWFLPDPWSMS